MVENPGEGFTISDFYEQLFGNLPGGGVLFHTPSPPVWIYDSLESAPISTVL